MSLADQLRAFVVATLEDLAEHHAPRLALPRVLAGYPVGPDTRADLIYTLGLLADAGVQSVAGLPVEEVLRAQLGRVDGNATGTFFSYRIAETLALWGPFRGNPLLEGLSPGQVAQLAAACDATDDIPGLDTSLPRNYLPVLARCELARHRLGLPASGEVLDRLVERTLALFTEQSGGFVDDARHRAGRFDIYTVDSYLFAVPLADRLGDAWTRGATRALELVELVAARNGAAIPWGRSAGGLALCLTLEIAGMGFEHGLIPRPAAVAWLERAETAFATLREWFSDGLIRAHQHRAPYAYRGPARRLQMTLDCLGKLALAAKGLTGAGGASKAADPAPVDRLLWFDDARRYGVWCYRSPELTFALPFVGATTTDYLPAPHSPGLFEVPVDSALATGVPFAIRDGVTYAPAGAPASVDKQPGGITVEHQDWHRTGEVNARFDPAGLAGRRRAVYQVRGNTVSVDEELWFDDVPDVVALQVADSEHRPLRVTVDATHPHVVSSVDTAGIREYRSYWGELPRIHQVDFTPARRVAFHWTVRPKHRILCPSAQHGYVRSLYRALADDVALLPWTYQTGLDEQSIPDCDGFHLHWPERMMPRQAALHQRFIAGLKARGIPILWTQHNLTPHDPGPEDDAIYRAWAAAADAVVHHSEHGMRQARATLPYSPKARHQVIPHGCFGEPAHRSGPDRRAVEASLGLRHDVLRLGVIGAPRQDKRVDLVMEAVAGSARDDIELVAWSLREGEEPPADPRIVARPYRYLPQQEYDTLLSITDVLVMPFYGDTMLTTGSVADAIGRGVPCLISPWPYLSETLGDAALRYGSSVAELRERLDTLSDVELKQAAGRMAALRPRYVWKRVGAEHLRLWEALTNIGESR